MSAFEIHGSQSLTNCKVYAYGPETDSEIRKLKRKVKTLEFMVDKLCDKCKRLKKKVKELKLDDQPTSVYKSELFKSDSLPTVDDIFEIQNALDAHVPTEIEVSASLPIDEVLNIQAELDVPIKSYDRKLRENDKFKDSCQSWEYNGSTFRGDIGCTGDSGCPTGNTDPLAKLATLATIAKEDHENIQNTKETKETDESDYGEIENLEETEEAIESDHEEIEEIDNEETEGTIESDHEEIDNEETEGTIESDHEEIDNEETEGTIESDHEEIVHEEDNEDVEDDDVEGDEDDIEPEEQQPEKQQPGEQQPEKQQPEEGEEEEGEEVELYAINGVNYYVTNKTNGIIYAAIKIDGEDDYDIGEMVGVFAKGKMVLR